jgi:thiamine biosynthesis lipoprotein
MIRWLPVLLAIATPAAGATQIHYVMGTFLRVVVDDDVPPSTFAGCFAAARRLDRTFSRFDPASELVRLNAAGGGAASADVRNALARAMALADVTHGSFDVSAGAVTSLWRAIEPPTPASIASARRTVGHVAVRDDRVVLGTGTQLDLDGFAKGVAVDACVEALRSAGVTRALVSFGESSLYGLGAPRGVAAWTLDVRGPDPDRVMARLALRDRGAAVSAVFGAGGDRSLRRGHIVDPRTGMPLAEDAVSVVVAPSAADAEAHAKAVLVRGPRGVAAAEDVAGVTAVRLTRASAIVGAGMRAGGAFHLLARPRPADGEVELR